MPDEEDGKESGVPIPQDFHGQAIASGESTCSLHDQPNRENQVCKLFLVSQSHWMRSVLMVQRVI